MIKLYSTRGMGIAFFMLTAFGSVSRAAIIVDNLSPITPTTSSISDTEPIAQVFMTGSASGILDTFTPAVSDSGGLVGMVFFPTASVEIDLYSTSMGKPSGSPIVLGTITFASIGSETQPFSFKSDNVLLSANTIYAIVMDVPSAGTVSWDDTSTPITSVQSAGSFQGSFQLNGSTWSSMNNDFMQMELTEDAVPEVPITGVFMGFGALAIAVGHSLGRKKSVSLLQTP